MDSDLFSYEICSCKFKPIAEELIKKYDELRHIDPDSILFVMNHKASGKNKKRVKLATTSKVPPKWQEIIYQAGGLPFHYMIEFYEKSVSCLDLNQMTALIYRELRRISVNGDIVAPDVHEWYNLLQGLGRHWFYPDATCPDLLAEDVDWKKLMGSFYEPPLPSD